MLAHKAMAVCLIPRLSGDPHSMLIVCSGVTEALVRRLCLPKGYLTNCVAVTILEGLGTGQYLLSEEPPLGV